MFLGSRKAMVTICKAYLYAMLDSKMAALHYITLSPFVVILGSIDLILVEVVVVVVVVVFIVVAVVAVMITGMLLCVIPSSS